MDFSNLTGGDKLAGILNSEASKNNIQLVKELLSSMSSVVCILNNRNEIIFANERLIEQYCFDLNRDLPGLRFGEVVNCINVSSPDAVCGSTEKCKYCGANYTFNDFWNAKQLVVNECRLIRDVNGNTQQVDLEITARPFHFEQDYMVVSLVDITDQKRRDILERIFFHDIINMAGSLKGVLDLMKEPVHRTDESFFEVATSLSTQIIEEIKGQHQVFKAEKGELEITPVKIYMEDFLLEVRNKVKYCQEAFERDIITEDHTGNIVFITDEVLLNRIIFNMAKNALEAIDRGELIHIHAYSQADSIRIEVINKTSMEEDVRNQLFQRSYSTKGKNRGIGTYSMKLLGERYLKGKVDFSSDEKNGTTFFIEIPQSI